MSAPPALACEGAGVPSSTWSSDRLLFVLAPPFCRPRGVPLSLLCRICPGTCWVPGALSCDVIARSSADCSSASAVLVYTLRSSVMPPVPRAWANRCFHPSICRGGLRRRASFAALGQAAAACLLRAGRTLPGHRTPGTIGGGRVCSRSCWVSLQARPPPCVSVSSSFHYTRPGSAASSPSPVTAPSSSPLLRSSFSRVSPPGIIVPVPLSVFTVCRLPRPWRRVLPAPPSP